MVLANVHIQKDLMQQNMKVSLFTNVIPSIEKGNIYNLVTTKIINPYTMVLSTLKFGTIKELYIATYAINLKAIKIFTNLLASKDVEQWTLLINENMKFRMKGKEVVLFEAVKAYDNFILKKARVHAKVTLIQVEDKYIVITGSGNYSENPKIEQYTICDNEELYNFHKEWINEQKTCR